MNTTIDTIIFDVGGVLLPNCDDYIKKDIGRVFDLDLSVVENAWDTLIPLLYAGKITEAEFWVKFRKITKCEKKIKTEHLLVREMEKRHKPFTDVFDIIEKLNKNGYKLGIISNTIKPHIACHAKHGLFDKFQVRVFSCDVGLKKPDLQIFNFALKKLDSRPKKTIFIDDLPENVSAAEKLGINGIVFKNGKQLGQALERLEIKKGALRKIIKAPCGKTPL